MFSAAERRWRSRGEEILLLLLVPVLCAACSSTPSNSEAYPAENTAAVSTIETLTTAALEQRQTGKLIQASESLQAAEALAGKEESPWLTMIYNNQALLAVDRKHWFEAARLFEKSAVAAEHQGFTVLHARGLANAASALAHTDSLDKAARLLDRSAGDVTSMPPSEKVTHLLMLGNTATAIVDRDSGRRNDMLPRLRIYADLAERYSRESANSLDRVYALASQSEVRAQEAKNQQAIQLAERGLFLNQQLVEGESSHASWLLLTHVAQLYRQNGDRLAALSAYERAVEHLDVLRSELLKQDFESPFLGGAAPAGVYRDLLDMMFVEAARGGLPRSQRDQWLLKARDYAEKMKAAEVRNYFRDDCVDTLQEKLRSVAEVSGDTVIIYPVVLEDRLELLVQHPSRGLLHFTSPVKRTVLQQTLAEYRGELEAKSIRFRFPAEQLYQWLVAPMQRQLGTDISTLVFVPGGQLAAVPMATLMSPGGQFLMEQYALAITPGVELTDPQPLDRTQLRPLYAGLSEKHDNFSALRAVKAEIAAVVGLFPGQVLMDDEFRVDTLNDRLQDDRLNTLHLATHGQFGDTVEESFILTSSGRLNMDQLSSAIGQFKYRDQPLDLLVLSACETASGSSRAALGLSGIAIKAGARSAIGTLWKVDDDASAELMKTFYKILKEQPGLSRAEVLRQSQLFLRTETVYANPGYWAPYILINSWL